MADGTALSRRDRNRNERLARLRRLFPVRTTVETWRDDTQATVVANRESAAFARRRVTCRAWELGELLDWGVEQARSAGFASVTVNRPGSPCEP